MECRKCTYFDKNKDADKYRKGKIILGFCRLRQKHISDETITKQFCKDKAVIS
jgi:hypothetical protein